MNRLEIRDITVGYGRKTIWTRLNLCAESGEFVVLLGKNGCGKTTLLKAIQGNLPLRTGSISINGTDLAALSVRQRAALVTTMPQEIPGEGGLTGMDYLEMGLYPARGPFAKLTKADVENIQKLADIFGVLPLLQRDLAEMSAGERQMISLLRAALQDTPVLLLDEPASALDFGHTATLFAMLQKLAAQGKCILAVLHDPTAAIRYGSRLLCLEDGQCSADFRPSETVPEQIEVYLRQLYPTLQLHTDPVFCWSEEMKTEE